MINNPAFESQLSMCKQAAQNSGISGATYLDVDPANGLIRIKFKVNPVTKQPEMVSSMGYILAQVLPALGLQVNFRERKNGEGSNG
jgi:hypothetical protein